MAKAVSDNITARRPMPGSLYTHPAASIVTGKCDGRLPKMDSLPFVKKNPPKVGGYCYWAVKPSGDYSADCNAGRAYAQMLLPFLKYNGGIPMLGYIIFDMIRSRADKKDKGLVVGFMAELSRELSSTRASLAIYAATAANPAPLPMHLKRGRATLKRLAAKAAIPTLKHLGDVI
jgi:hypothetical protein